MIVCSFDVKTLSKYDILVLVSNRLYLVLVIGLYTRYGGIETYLPRKGPETFISISTIIVKRYRNLFTSKGAGNSNLEIILVVIYPKYRNLFTSKGAGNFNY